MVWLHQRYALIGIGLLILMVLGSQGAIQVPPISKAVFLGASNVTMSCTSDTGASNIKWSHMQVGDPSGVYLAFGSFVEESQKNLYAVEQVGSQQIDLIILNVTMEMLGTYYCRDITEPKAYAQLIIIDSEPVCSMTPAAPLELMYSDTVEMSCNFSYFADASYVSGDLIWSKGSPATIIASFTETNTSANDNLITAASKLTQTPGNVNPFPIHRCNATFKFTDKMTHISSKSVDYSKSVQLFDSPIFVLVPVENISIHSTLPTSEYKCVDTGKPETLTCSANGNPPAQYVWLDLQNNITTTGAVLSISSGGEYQCTAFNIIRNQTYNATKTATEISCYISDHVRPSNAVTKFGGGAILNCSDPVLYPDWIMSKDGTAKNRLTIAVGCNVSEKLQDHYDVDKVGGLHACSLIVSKATMDQGGVYWCIGSHDRHRALLTVLDFSPTISYSNASMEGDGVVFTCALHYYGSVKPSPTLRPHFYWTDYTGDNVSNVYNPPPSNNSVVSQLTVTAGREDIMRYTCHVYMQLMPTTSPGYAGNIPTVNSSASSPTITVLYPVGKTTITSSTDGCIKKPETLTCSANGNPPAQYVWLDLKNNITTTGAKKSISSGGEYQCTASNSIRSQTYYETKTVTETSCHHEVTPVAIDGSTSATESPEHGEAAGGIDVDQAEDIGSGPAAGDKGVAKWNDGMAAEEAVATDKPKSNSGNGQGSFVLQLFIAAYVGLGQF